MAGVAQLVESQIVALVVASSSLVSRPSQEKKDTLRLVSFFYFHSLYLFFFAGGFRLRLLSFCPGIDLPCD